MCRFLIVKSKNKLQPLKILKDFSRVCRLSLAPDGEKQRDGFGIAWLINGKWNIRKSLSPIWEKEDMFDGVSETDLLVVHARGAGFEKDRGNIDYNEPFIKGNLCFIFNGMIRGVKVGRKLDGEIGSQKLFSLIELFLKQNPQQNVLEKIRDFILAKSEKIEGVNIGLITKDRINVLCQYSDNKEYFTLHYYKSPDITIISSEPFGDFKWNQFKNGEIKTFT